MPEMARKLPYHVPKFEERKVIMLRDLAKKLGTKGIDLIENLIRTAAGYVESSYREFKERNPPAANVLLGMYVPKIIEIAGRNEKAVQLVKLSLYLDQSYS